MRYTGVTARGVITPIFRQGDDIVASITDCVANAAKRDNFTLGDGDIVGVTEAVVARAQGNYATCEQIAGDIRAKFGGGAIGVVFPILSRNRFSLLLRAISKAAEKVYVQLSFPADEVGNLLMPRETFDSAGVNPFTASFDETSFRRVFDKSATVHGFTGVDYIEFYKEIGGNIEIIFSNDPVYILKYAKNVLACDIHTRARTKRLLAAAGAGIVLGLDDILTAPFGGSGYNPEFGLLGSNKAGEDKVKLFPRDCQRFAEELAAALSKRIDRQIEALVYGDGCFKDPVGGIWELADPVVCPGYTARLAGVPNEIKLKYFADGDFAHLSGHELEAAMRERIAAKDGSLVGSMQAEGTTPRRIRDLVGSLCDLVSGSGDRGTPVVLVQNYFANYATE